MTIPVPVISLEIDRDESTDHYDTTSEGKQEFQTDESTPNDNNEEKIVLTANELETEIQTAYQRGLSEGETIGYHKCESELKPLVEQIQKSIHSLEQAKIEISRTLEKSAAALSLKIARKIIEAEFSVHPEILIEKIKHIIHQILDDTEIIIYVHPEIFQILQENLDDIKSINPTIKDIQLVEDKSIKNSGVLIETRSGILDARLDSMLKEIEKLIQRKLEDHEPLEQ